MTGSGKVEQASIEVELFLWSIQAAAANSVKQFPSQKAFSLYPLYG